MYVFFSLARDLNDVNKFSVLKGQGPQGQEFIDLNFFIHLR